MAAGATDRRNRGRGTVRRGRPIRGRGEALAIYGLAPTLERRASTSGEILGPEEGSCAVAAAPPEAFARYLEVVAYVLERNELGIELFMYEERGLPLTTLLRRWAEDGPPPPPAALAIAPLRPPRLLAADELAAHNDRFTVGLDFGTHLVLLDTRHASDAMFVSQGTQEPELIMKLDAHSILYWVTDGDVRAFAATVAWMTASLQAAGIDPTIEIYADDVEEDEPLDVLPLTNWLRFAHRRILVIDERVQGEFVEPWRSPRPRGPAYASFLAACVGHR